MLATLKAGRLPFIEYGARELLTARRSSARLIFTSKPARSPPGPVIVTIGTPVDEFLNPERHVIQDCIDVLLPHLRDGQLLVLRSTLYPGTTEWINAYLKRKGRNLKVAFCPERIVQGMASRNWPECRRSSAAPRRRPRRKPPRCFAPSRRRSSCWIRSRPNSPSCSATPTATSNSPSTNQFYLIAKSAGLDYQRILQAMKHNYPRARNIPSPGYAAGPCLMKDTMQLMAFARNEFSLGNAAMLVNEGLPLHIVAICAAVTISAG